MSVAGHDLRVVEIYVARAATGLAPEALAALRDEDPLFALHYSKRSAEIFLRLVNGLATDPAIAAKLPKLKHFALSPEVAAPLEREFPGSVIAAQEPQEDSLLSLLARI